MRVLILIALLAGALAACSPNPARAGALAAGQTPRPTQTQGAVSALADLAPVATAYVAPTMNAALVARLTEASVQLAEAQARSAQLDIQLRELDARLTQSAATATAWPPMATKTAQLIVYANQTETSRISTNETATPAYATAQALSLTIERRARAAPMRDGLSWTALIVACILLAWVVYVMIKRRSVQLKLLRNDLELQELELVRKRQTARPDNFITRDPYTKVTTPVMPYGMTAEAIQRIAEWVVEHGYIWTDEMRSGQGVGIGHMILVAYRDGYLVRAGCLVRVNSQYVVTEMGRDYFRRKAGQQQETNEPDEEPEDPEPEVAEMEIVRPARV
jgi:hypothetical protein